MNDDEAVWIEAAEQIERTQEAVNPLVKSFIETLLALGLTSETIAMFLAGAAVGVFAAGDEGGMMDFDRVRFRWLIDQSIERLQGRGAS